MQLLVVTKKIETNFLKTVTKEQGKICKHYHNKNMSFIDKFHSIKILWIYFQGKMNYILSSKNKKKKEK